VVVKVKKALQKKHRQKTAEHPRRRPVNRMQLLRRVRQKMQQRDAQHEAGHETGRQLQARVGGTDDQQQPAARERREQNQRAIDCQQPDGGQSGHNFKCKSFAI
jgi:hypothetical protein